MSASDADAVLRQVYSLARGKPDLPVPDAAVRRLAGLDGDGYEKAVAQLEADGRLVRYPDRACVGMTLAGFRWATGT